jgi:hypothetical protein
LRSFPFRIDKHSFEDEEEAEAGLSPFPLQIHYSLHLPHSLVSSCIYSLAFNPDGSQLLVAIGTRVIVYDPNDGSVIVSLRGGQGKMMGP